MKNWFKQYEDIMSAAAFAEEGEFETARQMINGRQKVLLAVTGRDTDRKAFRYAVNTCKRIGAGLEILHIQGDGSALIAEFQDVLKKDAIAYEIAEGRGCIKEAVIKHTEERKDIQFVVIDSSEGIDTECRESRRSLSERWKALRCPLVVVSEAKI
ncbi:MAG: universal stress protein [Nitrospirae bacterium]|nr:universal stress protein [Nitrospirota bacterium]